MELVLRAWLTDRSGGRLGREIEIVLWVGLCWVGSGGKDCLRSGRRSRLTLSVREGCKLGRESIDADFRSERL